MHKNTGLSSYFGKGISLETEHSCLKIVHSNAFFFNPMDVKFIKGQSIKTSNFVLVNEMKESSTNLLKCFSRQECFSIEGHIPQVLLSPI